MIGVEDLKRQIPDCKTIAETWYGIKFHGNSAHCPRAENHNHGDRNPSLRFDTKKNRIFCASQHCFGEPGADAISLVMLMDNVPFPQAIERLATFYAILDNGNANGRPQPSREKSTKKRRALGVRAKLEREGFRPMAEFPYGENLHKVRFEHLTLKQEGKNRPEKTCLWEYRKDGEWWSGDGGLLKPVYMNAIMRDRDQVGTVLGFEGEHKADLDGELGFPAFSFKELSDENAPSLAAIDVVLWPDKDSAGLDLARSRAELLLGHARSVRTIAPPAELPTSGDIIDAVKALDWGRPEIDGLIQKATPFQMPTPQPGRPQIVTTARPLRDITADALKALTAANDPPRVFTRSGALVYVTTDEKRRPIVKAINAHLFRGLLARAADFVRVTGDGAKRRRFDCPPPMDVVRDGLALPVSEMGNATDKPGELLFPAIEAVVEVPILRPDGTVLDAAGYDPATRVVYMPAPRLTIPTIPANPTRENVHSACMLIDEAIGEFPYSDQPSRANTIAEPLTTILRRAVEGCAPLAILDAPQAGTGKSLLAEAISIVATGRRAAMMTAPKEEEEWRKRITAVLSTGASTVIIDNVEHRLESAALASVQTAPEWSDRLLGRNDEMISIPHCATWMVTGNNVKLGGDLPRRCFWIRLDAKTSRPWQRKGFKHQDLLAWVMEHRGRILAALLTVARAWFAAGMPVVNTPVVGGFESWTRTLGGVLAIAGIQGFLGNLESMYESADETGSQWEAFLEKLQDDCPDGFTCHHLVERLQSDEALKDLAPDEVAIDKPGSLQRRLGKAFSRRLGTRYGTAELYLDKAGERRRAARWVVRSGEFVQDRTNAGETPSLEGVTD